MTPFLSLGARRGCGAHTEGKGSDWICGACFPLLPTFTEVEGFSCPKNAPQRSCCRPTCCEERRSCGPGGSSVGMEVGRGRGLHCSKMAPCETLCEGQQDLTGDWMSPALAGRRGELWGTPAAMLPRGRQGEGLGVVEEEAPLWCGEGALALPQGPCQTMLCCLGFKCYV